MNTYKKTIGAVIIGIIASAVILFFAYCLYQDHKELAQDTLTLAQVVNYLQSPPTANSQTNTSPSMGEKSK